MGTLLGDISFLNQFKDKMIANSKDNQTVTKKEVGGRYSLIDRDLQSVDKASHVITELWKLPAEKSLNCLMGLSAVKDVLTVLVHLQLDNGHLAGVDANID